MRLYSLKVGEKEFKVALVSGDKEKKKGLSKSKALKDGYGMLFELGSETEAVMNMDGMNYDIDMLFINDDLKVIRAVKMSKTGKSIKTPGTRLVLEINKGAGKDLLGEHVELCRCLKQITGLGGKHDEGKGEGQGHGKHIEEEKKHHTDSTAGVNIIIKIQTVPDDYKEKFKRGGTIDLIEDEVKADKNKMQVLDDTGKVLMNLSGGERIFSIDHTKQLVNLAEKVDSGEADEEELGKLMSDIIEIQNTQEPQYV